MKVAMIIRDSAKNIAGGDLMQLLKTKEYLEKLSIKVDVYYSNQSFDGNPYDIIHFFNLIRPYDQLPFLKFKAKKVLSTIFVDYSEVDDRFGNRFKRIFKKLLGAEFSLLKKLVKSTLLQENFPNLKYLINGHRKSMEKVVNAVDILLPNSFSELNRIENYFWRVKNIREKTKVIPNGIDPNIFSDNQIYKREKNSILCVARIEPTKNQLNIIKALKNSDFKITFVGGVSKNQTNYFRACVNESAGMNVKFLPHVSQKDLVKLYKTHQVHILASWFETTGLSSLEAGYCGCNLVISNRGDQHEYVGRFSEICDPEDLISIRNAVERAMFKKNDNEELKNFILNNFTWEIAAKKTLEAYHEVLEK